MMVAGGSAHWWRGRGGVLSGARLPADQSVGVGLMSVWPKEPPRLSFLRGRRGPHRGPWPGGRASSGSTGALSHISVRTGAYRFSRRGPHLDGFVAGQVQGRTFPGAACVNGCDRMGVGGRYGRARTEAAGVLRADPTLLRELVERCGTLRRRLASGGNTETVHRPANVTHTPCAVTGTRRMDAAPYGALHAARRQSACAMAPEQPLRR